MRAEELDDSLLVLQARHEHVEVHPVNPLDRQPDMTADDLGHALCYHLPGSGRAGFASRRRLDRTSVLETGLTRARHEPAIGATKSTRLVGLRRSLVRIENTKIPAAATCRTARSPAPARTKAPRPHSAAIAPMLRAPAPGDIHGNETAAGHWADKAPWPAPARPRRHRSTITAPRPPASANPSAAGCRGMRKRSCLPLLRTGLAAFAMPRPPSWCERTPRRPRRRRR